MIRYAFLALALLLPAVASAADAEAEAKVLAQDILTKGAALFDTRDASAMAATYVEEAELSLISKDKDTGRFKAENTHGRTSIERFYQDLFKDRKPGTTSRNVVEYARFVGTDVLIIHGKFTLDVTQGDALPFVQVRVKDGDKWLIMNLQIVLPS
ncbi:MAG: hypothetical protein P4L84_32680 [Isosphaeraceae bacterium]|nr:hypothetical protein [Isosphaeraceae bacterium]